VFKQLRGNEEKTINNLIAPISYERNTIFIPLYSSVSVIIATSCATERPSE
jgi:hypothetical protein